MMRKRIWDYLERNPITPDTGSLPASSGRLFRTKNFRIIAEYLGRVFDEVKRRPLYLVQDLTPPFAPAGVPPEST